jgi:hypothetical protein
MLLTQLLILRKAGYGWESQTANRAEGTPDGCFLNKKINET